MENREKIEARALYNEANEIYAIIFQDEKLRTAVGYWLNHDQKMSMDDLADLSKRNG